MELNFTSEEIWGAWEEIKVGLETANQFYETDMYSEFRTIIQKLLESYVGKVLKEDHKNQSNTIVLGDEPFVT